MLYESRQTRLGQPAAEKYGTVSADLMREYGLRLEKTCKSLLAAVRLQADSQTPSSPFPLRQRRRSVTPTASLDAGTRKRPASMVFGPEPVPYESGMANTPQQ